MQTEQIGSTRSLGGSLEARRHWYQCWKKGLQKLNIVDYLNGGVEQLRDAVLGRLAWISRKEKRRHEILDIFFSDEHAAIREDELKKDELLPHQTTTGLYNGHLSFTDNFDIINGVPAFLLMPGTTSNSATSECSKSSFDNLVTVCQFSNDETKLFSGHNDGSLRVWNANNGSLVRKCLEVHESAVCDLSFEEPGTLLSCDKTGTCHVWNTSQPAISERIECPLKPFYGDNSLICQPHFVRNEMCQRLVVYPIAEGSISQPSSLQIRIFDIQQTARLDGYATLQIIPQQHYYTGCYVSPDCKQVTAGFSPPASQCCHGITYLWLSLDQFQLPIELPGGLSAWSRFGDYLATWDPPLDATEHASRSSETFLWKLSCLSGQVRNQPRYQVYRTSRGHSICWCRFLDDSSLARDHFLLCCICAPGGTVYFTLYSIETSMPVHSINTGIPTEPSAWPMVSCGFLETDENYSKRILPIAGNAGSSRVGVTNMSSWSGVIINTIQGVKEIIIDVPDVFSQRLGSCTGLELSKNTGKIALVGSSGILLLLPSVRSEKGGYKSATCISLDQPPRDQGVDIQFSGDGSILGTRRKGSSELRISNLDSGQNVLLPIDPDLFFSFSFDGQWLATCTKNQTIHMFSVSMSNVVETEVFHLDHNSPLKAFSLLQDSGRFKMSIVYCDSSGTLTWLNGADADISRPRQSSLKIMFARLLLNMKTTRGNENRRWFENIETKREEQVGSYACRFSADGRLGLLMRTPTQMDLWNLARRTRLRCMAYPIDAQPLSPSKNQLLQAWRTAMLFNKRTLRETSKFGSIGRIIDVAPARAEEEILAVSDDGRWIVVSSEVPAAPMESEKQNDSSENAEAKITHYLIFIDTTDRSRQRVLHAPSFCPGLGCALSSDGRRFASVTGKGEVIVWSALATEGLIPDYHLLAMTKRSDNEEYIQTLLRSHGPALYNLPGSMGLPLLMQAVINLNFKLFDALVDGPLGVKSRNIEGSKEDMKIILRVDDDKDVVGLACDARSPNFIQKVLEIMMCGCTQDSEKAFLLEKILGRITQDYPTILSNVLNDDRIFIDICKIKVREEAFWVMGETTIVTSFDFLNGSSEHYQAILDKKTEWAMSSVHVPARVRAIPFPHIASLGFDGLLSHLLSMGAPVDVYASPPIRHLIDYKWKGYVRQYVINEVMHYLLLLLTFTMYSLMMGSSWDEASNTRIDALGSWMLPVLGFSVLLGAINLAREILQMQSHIQHKGFHGLFFYMQSVWNWVEIGSYLLLVVVIPFVHFWEDPNENVTLTWLIAIESVILWWKILYYMQAFRPTAPLVISIGKIISDIKIWFLLASMVLIGFGVAFFVFYRHVRYHLDAIVAIDDSYEGVRVSFSSIPRSFATLFGYALGDFNFEDLYNVNFSSEDFTTPPKFATMAFFVVYLFVMGIILLNLLIAVMLDSYNRVTNDQETEFLKARAEMIHDVETMMSSRTKQKIQILAKPFLHVIQPIDTIETVLKEIAPETVQALMNRELNEATESELSEIRAMLTQVLKEMSARKTSSPIT